ncbi:pyridoxamine 5'-phosphate oxidase family protein [Caminicella sporogenes]|uniref:pyridoxamine 5'-phosphate oxidase family protein n=1 Tax=Caminicella sporogenes TaxID=166485 RepID=UPI002540D9EA|nr:pyridoxamine 5'-phosphate oxidase family protein [Caminicella sporogenes]WIF95468.1 pyridoxamine 5'-phosphate oxidase family protein [Caminicella sporogenes]
MKKYLEKKVMIVVDRPLGSKHPKHGFVYPINYGYIPNTVSGDGEEIDAYILGEFEPLKTYEGYVTAVVHRKNDDEDKLVVSRELNMYNKDQIRALIEFQERFFKSEIVMYEDEIEKDIECEEIKFDELKIEFEKLIKIKKYMVLATSKDNRVTARSVSCIVINSKIYFQTDKTFLKYKQIKSNPNVALCIDNFQVEGYAKIKGHPFEIENKNFIEVFKKVHNGSFNTYSHMENEVVIEVEPKFVTAWKYENGKAFKEILDFKNRKAYRKYYDNSK